MVLVSNAATCFYHEMSTSQIHCSFEQIGSGTFEGLNIFALLAFVKANTFSQNDLCIHVKQNKF
jgi:hypothetical protein